MSNFELVRDAHVSVTATRDTQNHPVAIAEINGKHEHRFDAHSRVSKALELMTPVDLADRLSGGQFFFVDNKLVDFRDGHYNGFVHTDEAVGKLMEVLGTSERTGRMRNNTMSSDIVLGRKWSDHSIHVPAYRDGGQFNSELRFTWNPFVRSINSAFMLVRLLCTNGMVGLTSFLNTKIPMINRWEEHLDIANRQIQNKVEGMVARRLGAMGSERGTVNEAALVAEHASRRLSKGNVTDQAARERLATIARIAHPVHHLSNIYRRNVFEDARLGAQMPAHLSTFDLYNMATEISSHTSEVDGSSNHALDKFANGLVFDRKDLTQGASRFMMPKQSDFSDPDAAFFGTLN